MYIVIELQKNSDGTLGNIVQTFENRNSAESAYHSILASAAISALPVHSATILTEEGQQLLHGSYAHKANE